MGCRRVTSFASPRGHRSGPECGYFLPVSWRRKCVVRGRVSSLLGITRLPRLVACQNAGCDLGGPGQRNAFRWIRPRGRRGDELPVCVDGCAFGDSRYRDDALDVAPDAAAPICGDPLQRLPRRRMQDCGVCRGARRLWAGLYRARLRVGGLADGETDDFPVLVVQHAAVIGTTVC